MVPLEPEAIATGTLKSKNFVVPASVEPNEEATDAVNVLAADGSEFLGGQGFALAPIGHDREQVGAVLGVGEVLGVAEVGVGPQRHEILAGHFCAAFSQG